jgi:membrane protein DedA with SNARE-associated domain
MDGICRLPTDRTGINVARPTPWPGNEIARGVSEQLGYLAVLVGTFLEGETVLVLAGLAAQHGYLSFPAVVAVAATGAFVGDQVYFFIGRRYGNRLLARFPSLAAKVPRVQALLKRWDLFAVILVRFLYGLRIAGAVVIGSCGISPWRLALFNLIGVLIWAPLIAGIGYFAGQAIQEWAGRLHQAQILLVMGLVVAVTLAWLVIRWRRG